METMFEKYINHRIRVKGRQDIDENTIRELHCFGENHFLYEEPKTLQIDWPKWLKKAENNFKTIYGETEIENHERCRRFIHHYLEDIFILESSVIRVCYEEFYSDHLFYDEVYFNKIKTDFRKSFKSDFRLPELSYFDDLIEEIEANYKPNEKSSFDLRDYLKHPEQYEKLKDLMIAELERYPYGKIGTAADLMHHVNLMGYLERTNEETRLKIGSELFGIDLTKQKGNSGRKGKYEKIQFIKRIPEAKNLK